jgi:nucleotide-binding universal stress UspA family protein
MYKKILVPLDGSRRAETILPHVEQIARWSNASLVFMRVLEPNPIIVDPYDPQPVYPVHEEMEKQAQEVDTYLAGVAGEMREKGIEVARKVVRGPIVESILNVAEDIDADLIAMASHGRSGLARVFYGSVAAGVLQRVNRPLLLIRARTQDK